MGTSQLADNATRGKPTHEVTGALRELTATTKIYRLWFSWD